MNACCLCLRELARNKFISPPRNSEWAGNFPSPRSALAVGRPLSPSPRRASVSFLALSGPELIASSPQATAAAATEGEGAGSLKCLLPASTECLECRQLLQNDTIKNAIASALRRNSRLNCNTPEKDHFCAMPPFNQPPGATLALSAGRFHA